MRPCAEFSKGSLSIFLLVRNKGIVSAAGLLCSRHERGMLIVMLKKLLLMMAVIPMQMLPLELC